MKITAILLASFTFSVDGFAPSSRSAFTVRTVGKKTSTTTARNFGVDPSSFHDISQHLDTLHHAFGSISLADAAAEVADEAAAQSNNGWFGFLTGPIEGLLNGIHSGLNAAGLKSNTWGISIIALTALIKLATFPLTKQQLESTTKLQALSPQIKEIQTKYASNPEVMNQKIAEFYQANEINPLAGCLPSFAQIPIFIGLYRAVLELAKNNALDEPFLWLPNLEGPTYGADPSSGSDWILKGWTDGTPSLGWDDTISFLILPVFLVASQFASMQLMQPKSDDPAQQQSNAILKVLPFMIGWFSLNVPAALTVYWAINNIITTATSLFIRNSLKVEAVMPTSKASTSPSEPAQIFAPPPQKPAGFGDVKPLTVTDAEIVDDEDGDNDVPSGTGMSSSSNKKRGGKKKKN